MKRLILSILLSITISCYKCPRHGVDLLIHLQAIQKMDSSILDKVYLLRNAKVDPAIAVIIRDEFRKEYSVDFDSTLYLYHRSKVRNGANFVLIEAKSDTSYYIIGYLFNNREHYPLLVNSMDIRRTQYLASSKLSTGRIFKGAVDIKIVAKCTEISLYEFYPVLEDTCTHMPIPRIKTENTKTVKLCD